MLIDKNLWTSLPDIIIFIDDKSCNGPLETARKAAGLSKLGNYLNWKIICNSNI